MARIDLADPRKDIVTNRVWANGVPTCIMKRVQESDFNATASRNAQVSIGVLDDTRDFMVMGTFIRVVTPFTGGSAGAVTIGVGDLTASGGLLAADGHYLKAVAISGSAGVTGEVAPLDIGAVTDSTGGTASGGLIMSSAAGASGTATFTFSDKPNEVSTITITDSDGTAIIFEVDADVDGASGSNVALNGIVAAGGGATGTAADLVAKVNAQGSLDIVATNPSTGVVVLTQGTGGTDGNKALSVNNASHWNSVCSVNVPSAFTGGTSETAQINHNFATMAVQLNRIRNGLVSTQIASAITFGSWGQWGVLVKNHVLALAVSAADANLSVLTAGDLTAYAWGFFLPTEEPTGWSP